MDTAFLSLSSPGARVTQGQLQEGTGLYLFLIVHIMSLWLCLFPLLFFSLFSSAL